MFDDIRHCLLRCFNLFRPVLLHFELLGLKCHFGLDFIESGVFFDLEMKMLFVLVLTFAVKFGLMEGCPLNCICEKTETSCYLTNCNDEIALEYMLCSSATDSASLMNCLAGLANKWSRSLVMESRSTPKRVLYRELTPLQTRWS